MEEEKKFGSSDTNDVQNEVNVGSDDQEQKISHSHHSSHLHHGRHHSSHHRKHDQKKKKSLLDRIQSWIDKRVSGKRLIVMSFWVILITSLLIGVVYVVETHFPDIILTDKYQEDVGSGEIENETHNQSAAVPMTAAIPSYWAKMIKEKTQTIKALQTTGGVDCVSFVWASDTHIPDNDTARTDDLGKIMAKMMDDCEIPFAVLTGDIGTRVSRDTEAELINAHSKIPVHLAPLWGTDRLLVALGNHDGCYGDISGAYKKQLSPQRMWQMYFRGQALDSRREFSDDGSYFYVDNKAQKIRFIILNSQFGGEYLTDGTGWAVNDRFTVSCYGQEQLDWLAEVALDMPQGYGAVIAAHVPPKVLYSTHTEPYTVDCDQICGIIRAYNHRTTFKGSYTAGVDGWSNSTVDVDFADAKGEIIAMFAGHVHHDSVDTTTLGCPLVTIISAGASVNIGEGPSRTFYTDTETSFDVVTINRKTRTIYCTRIGAGEDRTIKY